MTDVTPTPGTPTQVAHPGKAVVRTVVAWAAGFGIAWLARVVGIDLTDLSQPIVDSLTVGVWGIVTSFVQWLLTRPRLLPFWEAIGLGTGVEKEGRSAY